MSDRRERSTISIIIIAIVVATVAAIATVIVATNGLITLCSQFCSRVSLSGASPQRRRYAQNGAHELCEARGR